MNKQTLIWTLIVAVPVGIAALVTGYIYRDSDSLPMNLTGQPEVAETQTSQETPAPAAETKTGVKATETAEAGGEDAPAEATPATGKPSFDVVGVEPTGETVVAGRSDAGAIVALVANGEVVGKSIANEAGEWTIILDQPLKPGDYDVGLEVHDQNGEAIDTSDERLAVSVPQDGQDQPLVVLNSPDGPSDILQKPAGETVVAAVENRAGSTEPTKTEEPTAAEAPAFEEKPSETAEVKPSETTEPQQQSASASQTAGSEQTSSTEASIASAVETTPAATETASSDQSAGGETPASPEGSEAPVETADGQATQTTEVAAAPASTESPAPAQTAPASSAATQTPAPKTGETAVAAVDNTSTETAGDAASAPAVGAAPTVTVEAVESEKDKVFVAGTGEPGSSVRVYVGDDYQGEAKVDPTGKWLVEGTKNVAEGNVEVRADVIGNDGNSVDARAAVTFEKEQDQQIVLTKVVATGEGSGGTSQGAEVKKALPVVIIRKGDNLWRISRRLYGDGVRYTTIYQANQDQIRNPDLIYPGQVFLTPEGDLNWKAPEDGNNG